MAMKHLLFGLLIVVSCAIPLHAARTGPFIIGADISWIPEDEAAGATYFDHGEQKDIFDILKSNGFNTIRLRIFVNPGSAIGYAKNMKEPFCDLAHTLAMAKRIKAAGMGFFLDFHYSDNWADPGKQIKPAAWELMSLDELMQAVHDHTHDVLAALAEQGTLPAMVQVGNEIRPGMLWPEGRVGLKNHTDDEAAWDRLGALLNAGVSVVHEVDPSIKIVMHSDAGFSNADMRYFVDHLLARKVPFDIIGMSCYRQNQDGDWANNFQDLAKRYPDKDLLVCEYSSRKRLVNEAIHAVPDERGLGAFIWEPTRHKEAIFNVNGKNAGGGETNYFNTTVPSVRATTRPRPTTQATQPRRRNFGSRYDANEWMQVYLQIKHDYAE